MGSSIPAFSLESQSFSKRVDQQDLQEGKLKIPKIAVRNYGKCMAAGSVLFLKLPNGGVWPIELKLCTEGRFWLQEGWPRFANFYSLDHGYTLRFKCQDESSCFLVRIFDSNNLEIDYPLGSYSDDEKPSREETKRRSGKVSGADSTSDDDAMARERPAATDLVEVNINYRFMISDQRVHNFQVIPKAVAEAEGLTGKKKLLLLDPSGKPWDVKPTVMLVLHHLLFF